MTHEINGIPEEIQKAREKRDFQAKKEKQRLLVKRSLEMKLDDGTIAKLAGLKVSEVREIKNSIFYS